DDAGHAADDDPVFAAMVVHLQREAFAGGDDEALDLEVFAFFERGVAAPGAVYGAVQFVDVVVVCAQAVDDALDVLDVFPVGHEEGVWCVDDDEVVYADGGHEAVVAADETVLAVVQHGGAFDPVAFSIRCVEFADGVPRADVAPADGAGYDGCAVGFFHQGVVEGDVGHGGEGVGVEFDLEAFGAAGFLGAG